MEKDEWARIDSDEVFYGADYVPPKIDRRSQPAVELNLENLPNINGRKKDLKAKKGRISGFGVFIRENTRILKNEFPDLEHKHIFRKTCEKWNQTDKAEKQKYIEKA